MKGGNDRGFFYWHLSYKAKFKRNIWLIPFCILLTVWFLIAMPFSTFLTISYLVLLWIITIGTTLYTYKKWKSETRE